MQKVDAPKKDKKPVDALTPEQAKQFFSLLLDSPLEFHCMMQLLVTSGIRQGRVHRPEMEGHRRAGRDNHHRAERGLHPGKRNHHQHPKNRRQHTDNSNHAKHLETAPAVKEASEGTAPRHHSERGVYLPGEADLFTPRDPNAVTRRVKRFMKRNGLPDLSPHDLRHSCLDPASLPRRRHQERTGDFRPRRRKYNTELLCQSGLAADAAATEKYAAAFNL